MLKVANVTSFYGKTPAIWNIDIQLAKGECLSIIGRNGVGKTTLLKAIMGLTTRSDGKIIVDDLDLSHAGTHKRAIAGLGYVPQGRGIISKFTIRENLFLGTFASGTSIGVIPDICLEVFPYLRENLDRKAGTLSGGQMQQLAIARALATDPKVLLLDEPTEGIQPNIVADIYDKLSVLNKEMGITMVLTEQHIKLAKLLSDKYIVLDVGRIVQRGDSRKLTDDILDKYLSI